LLLEAAWCWSPAVTSLTEVLGSRSSQLQAQSPRLLPELWCLSPLAYEATKISAQFGRSRVSMTESKVEDEVRKEGPRSSQGDGNFMLFFVFV